MFLMAVLTRLAGIIREALIASQFGTSASLDAVMLGLSLPMALAVAVGGGLARAVVPVASGLDRRRVGGLMIVAGRRLLICAVVGCVALAAGAYWWTRLLMGPAAGLDHALVHQSALVASLAVAGGSFAGLLVGFANATGRHVAGGANSFVYNLVIIGTVIVLGRTLGPFSVLVGIVLAEWLQMLALWPAVRTLRQNANLDVSPQLGLLTAATIPTVMVGFFQGLGATVARSLSTNLAEGAVSALSYAEKLVNLPATLVGTTLAVPLFTRLARFAAEGASSGQFERTLYLGVRLTLMAGLPIGILTAGLAEPIVALLLARGQFTPDNAAVVGQALRGYAIGVPFMALLPLLLSAMLARGRHWEAVTISVVSLLCGSLVAILLMKPLGIAGISAGIGVGAALSAIGMARISAPKLFHVMGRSASIWRMLLLALVFGVLVTAVRVVFGSTWVQGPFNQMVVIGMGIIFPSVVLVIFFSGMMTREWNEVTALRKRVAADAQGQPTPRPAPAEPGDTT